MRAAGTSSRLSRPTRRCASAMAMWSRPSTTSSTSTTPPGSRCFPTTPPPTSSPASRRDVNHAVDLNSFYGYAPAINRTTGVRAQFVTDPSCIYDAATQRFFLVVLTLETRPERRVHHGQPPRSRRQPDVQPDGHAGRSTGSTSPTTAPIPAAVNPGPCLGDYPHIGADANGFYVTTNAYPWCRNGFAGAQIYAFSKAQLAAGAASVTMVAF